MGKSATGEGFVAVTPSNTVDITKKDGKYPRAIYFGTGGSCTVVAPDNSTAALVNIQNGFVLDCDVKRINTTGLTGCADIVGLY